MGYTDADLTARIEALETALDRHVQTVQFADRSVTYSSTEQILSRLDYFKRLLNGLQSTRRAKQTYGVSTKGF